MKKLGFGFMRLPVLDASERSTVDIEEVERMVDCYMGLGFTYFDVAHRYHDEASEPALRETLTKRYARDSFVLANKITLNYMKCLKAGRDAGIEVPEATPKPFTNFIR